MRGASSESSEKDLTERGNDQPRRAKPTQVEVIPSEHGGRLRLHYLLGAHAAGVWRHTIWHSQRARKLDRMYARVSVVTKVLRARARCLLELGAAAQPIE